MNNRTKFYLGLLALILLTCLMTVLIHYVLIPALDPVLLESRDCLNEYCHWLLSLILAIAAMGCICLLGLMVILIGSVVSALRDRGGEERMYEDIEL